VAHRVLFDASMKKTRFKLQLDRETVRNLTAAEASRVAGAAVKSADSQCVYCPLYSIPINECPMISREVVCTIKK
jgi:hypothetical protein